MKKLFLGFTVLWIAAQNCFATMEENATVAPAFGIRATPKSEPSSNEYRTEWSIGLGLALDSSAELHVDPRLYMRIETSKFLETSRGRTFDGMPEWTVCVNFEDRSPQSFFYLYAKEKIESLEDIFVPDFKTAALYGVGGAIAGAGMAYAAGMGPVGVGIGAGLIPLSLVLLKTGVLKEAAGSLLPPVERFMRSDDDRDSVIRFSYHIKDTISERESVLFYEQTEQHLNNESEGASPIKRTSQHDPRKGEAAGPMVLFSQTLDEPILHVVDVYKRLRELIFYDTSKYVGIPRALSVSPSEVVRPDQLLRLKFQASGVSNNPTRYVRNWNSFVVLAARRCFGIPFEVDPRLEEYIDDVKLIERWDSKLSPTTDNIIERVLVSYEKIKRRNPQFVMNRDYVKAIGDRLDGWFSKSEITKQLERIGTIESGASGGGSAGAGKGK